MGGVQTFRFPAWRRGIRGVRPSPVGVALVPWLVMFLSMCLPVALPYAWYTALFAVFVLAGLTSLIPTRVAVGPDGVDIRFLRRHRFLPLRSIASVHAYPSSFWQRDERVELLLEGGERLVIDGSGYFGQEFSADLALAIEVARGEMRDAAALPPLLERSPDETSKAFIARLRELGRSSASAGGNAFRSQAVPFDEIERRVHDPSVDPHERAAAAVALAAASNDDRERARIAATECAHPEVRVVFEASWPDGDEDRVAAALDALARERR